MSARPVIQTYRLASLHEAAIARLKNPKNDRYKELYLQNRGIGEKVYNAVLSGRLDLACFCGDSSKYYSVLTRSTRQDGALQVTEIDRKGPIGHRLLTGPKQLELPGCGGRRRFRCLTVHGTGNPRCRWIQDATRSEFQSRQMQGRSSTARR